MKKIIGILILFFSSCIFANDKINTLPGVGKTKQSQYAGYLPAGHHNKMFYWFVATKNKNAPIILWSNGGPGYSSMYGFFYETGPYIMNNKGNLTENKHGWNRFANYLVIDHPVNVGMSNLPGNHIVKTPAKNIQTLYHALKHFFKKYPQYRNNSVFLAGESYAGKYLPQLAKTILKHNKTAKHKIHLSGVILVSSWADPIVQMSMDSTYAFTHGLIDSRQKRAVDAAYKRCASYIRHKQYLRADKACDAVVDKIQSFSGVWTTNTYKQYDCSGDAMVKYLNKPAVKKALHATKAFPYQVFSDPVNQKYLRFIDRPIADVYEYLLSKHVPLLIMSGLSDDKDTNFMGVNKFISTLSWDQKSNYLAAKTHKIWVGKRVLGYQKTGPLLTRITIRHAGHMIPQDQPDINKVIKQFVTKHA